MAIAFVVAVRALSAVGPHPASTRAARRWPVHVPAVWTASRIFDVGDVVLDDGELWEAQWWTRNQEPGEPWGPWRPAP